MILTGNSSFWLSTLLKCHLDSFLRITRQQNWALPAVNEQNPQCVDYSLAVVWVEDSLAVVWDGYLYREWFLCSLYSQLTCHGNWNLSQVFGELELLNQTVIIEFHAYRNYDKWSLPVLVFCLCRARMSLKPARLLTWDVIYTHLPLWPPNTYCSTLCRRKMLPKINATSSSERELCRHNIVLEARRPQVLGTICYGLYVTFKFSIWQIMDHAPNSFCITYGSVRTLAIIAS